MADDTTRFDRLPKWAQQEIRSLRAKAERTVAEVEAYLQERERVKDESKATVWLDPFDRVPRPIETNNDRVRFCLDGIDGHQYFDVKVERGALDIMASRGLSIETGASNCIRIKVREW
jgi:hypothetical protein